MTEHMCVTGKWAGGYTRNCDDCNPPVEHGPIYLKEGYKTSTRTTRKPRGKQVEHWSGRQDAMVRPKAIRLSGKAKEI